MLKPEEMDPLRGKRIAIIGTGALGSTLLEHLAGRGLHSALLIDPDRLEERNLALSVFLQRAMHHHTVSLRGVPADLRPMKADLLAEFVTQQYGLSCRAIVAEIADTGWEHLMGVDRFYCCTDSALSRAESTYVARMLRKPMIDGGVFGKGIQEGRVSNFPAKPEAACYLCGMSGESRAAVLGYAASASLGCQAPEDAPAMTATMRTVRVTAERMSSPRVLTGEPLLHESRAIKVFAGDNTSVAGERAPRLRYEQIILTRSATCPWHEGLPGQLESLPWDVPLRTSMRSLDGSSRARELQLAWPVCTEAACAVCGFRSQPFLRVASVRRSALCSNCHGRGLQPIRAAHRIRTDDPLSERSPRQLGQPDRHLYWLRDTAGTNGLVHEDAT